jgi:hypothetical protein
MVRRRWFGADRSAIDAAGFMAASLQLWPLIGLQSFLNLCSMAATSTQDRQVTLPDLLKVYQDPGCGRQRPCWAADAGKNLPLVWGWATGQTMAERMALFS